MFLVKLAQTPFQTLAFTPVTPVDSARLTYWWGVGDKLQMHKLWTQKPEIIIGGLLIPIVLIIIGGMAKKLARGRGWKREDFFFGIELTLSAISGALTFLVSSFSGTNNADIQIKLAVFLLICFGFFTFVLALHQEYQGTTPKREYLWLTFVSNIIGIGLMFLLVVWIQAT